MAGFEPEPGRPPIILDDHLICAEKKLLRVNPQVLDLPRKGLLIFSDFAIV